MATTEQPTTDATVDGRVEASAPKRVLIADDDRISRHRLRAMLSKQGYEVTCAEDGEEARHILAQDNAPQLVLVDWMMPGMSGIELCHLVRQQRRGAYVYVLLLTARDNQEDILQGMRAGADDYVTKPFDAHELMMRLHAGQRVLDLQARLLATQHTLEVQATHDALTGLLNRRAIMDALDREASRANRTGEPLAVVMCDLDHFKRINDTYGHPVGDQVLKEAASAMRSWTRRYDSVGRCGGEEFLIVMPGCGWSQAASAAERLCKRIAEARTCTLNGHVPTTLSLGVAVSHPTNALTPDAMLKAADGALYRAKALGRNRVETAQEDLQVGPATPSAAQAAPASGALAADPAYVEENLAPSSVETPMQSTGASTSH